jgi:hypothetical protein
MRKGPVMSIDYQLQDTNLTPAAARLTFPPPRTKKNQAQARHQKPEPLWPPSAVSERLRP